MEKNEWFPIDWHKKVKVTFVDGDMKEDFFSFIFFALSLKFFTCVCVPEVSSSITSVPLVTECIAIENGALCDVWYSVIVLCTPLMDTVPVNGQLHAFHLVSHVDHNFITLANLKYKQSGEFNWNFWNWKSLVHAVYLISWYNNWGLSQP